MAQDEVIVESAVAEQQPAAQEPAPEQPADAQAGEQEQAPERQEGEDEGRFKRRLDRWKTRAIQAEERLRAIEEARQRETPAPAAKEDGKPDPVKYDFGADDPKYTADLLKWEIREERRNEDREAERLAIEAMRTERTEERLDLVRESVEAAKARFPDFDALVAKHGQAVQLPPAMLEIVAETGDPAGAVYWLLQNPATANKLAEQAAANPVAAAIRLANGMASGKSRAAPSKAPPPIEPVTAAGSAGFDPSKLSDSEWIAWRNKQVRDARRGK
jgi:hypothetical protein